MIFNICGLIIGILILGGGIYYFVKEKDDKESNKIYGIISVVGLIITIFIIVKMIMESM